MKMDALKKAIRSLTEAERRRLFRQIGLYLEDYLLARIAEDRLRKAQK